MKRKVIDTLAGLGVFAILIGFSGVADLIETRYTRDGIITGYYEDACVAEDKTGNEWCFIGEGFEIGDKVKIYMDTNHTDSNIYDDIVRDVKLIEED